MFTNVANGLLKFAVVVVIVIAILIGVLVGGTEGLVIALIVGVIGVIALSSCGMYVEMAVNIKEIKEYITSGRLDNPHYIQGPRGTVSNANANLSQAASYNNANAGQAASYNNANASQTFPYNNGNATYSQSASYNNYNG